MNPLFLWAAVITAASAAAVGGYFASSAFSQGEATATKTVTINVATGAQGEPGPVGPAGPKGDPGEPGASTCPSGFSFGEAVFIQKDKGPTTLFTCIKD